MADILIRGMAMPENCGNCFFCDDWAKCQLLNLNNIFDYCKDGIERPAKCPLVPLPEKHGRLIDVDVMVEGLMKCAKNPPDEDRDSRWFYLFAAEIAKYCPTIVPAEGGNDDA